MEAITLNLIMMFAIGLMGMVVHFIKKYQQGPGQGVNRENGTNALIACYRYFFKVDILNTIVAFIGYSALFGVLYSQNGIDYVSVITAGFTCDSFFNRAKSGKI